MASDLKIEIFASQLFERYWCSAEFLSHQLGVSSLYPEEYYLDPENANLCEDSHLRAVSVKHLFYHFVFLEEFDNFIINFEPSPSYILDYISRTCSRNSLFAGLTVFELFFSSCAFVVHLCFICVAGCGYKDALCYVHLCWAMYFDEYKEEFYRQGGWKQLKIVSLSYEGLYEIFCTLTNMIFDTNENRRACIHGAIKAVDNYKTFLSCIQDNCKTVSNAWLKFNFQNLYKSDASDILEDMTKAQDMREVEKFLLQLRRLCDPTSSELLNIEGGTKSIKTIKNSIEKISQSLSKLNILALNSMARNTTGDFHNQQKGQDLQETDDETNKLIAIDPPRSKRNVDESNEANSIHFPQSKNSPKIENDISKTASFLKLENTSHNTIEKKLKDKHKNEIDPERESHEVKCLLKMILVLGNPSGIIHARSSLPCSETHQGKKKSKKK